MKLEDGLKRYHVCPSCTQTHATGADAATTLEYRPTHISFPTPDIPNLRPKITSCVS